MYAPGVILEDPSRKLKRKNIIEYQRSFIARGGLVHYVNQSTNSGWWLLELPLLSGECRI